MKKELRMYAISLSEAEHDTVMLITDESEAQVLRRFSSRARILASRIMRNQDTYRKAIKKFPELGKTLDQVFEFAVWEVAGKKR